MTIPGFVFRAHAPRTKKTSNRIIQIKGKNGGRGFTKILPSEAHQEWFDAVLPEAMIVKAQLRVAGVECPVAHELNCRALFYRERESGDAIGYYQSLADLLQEQKVKHGRVIRKGAGIIVDDRQIVSWDGSRMLKDAADPRIEVYLEVVSERPVPRELFAEAES